MNKTAGILLVCAAFCVAAARAQDAVFCNPYSNPIYLNPAYTGLPVHWRAGLNYHYQGIGGVSPYMAYSVYADYFWDSKNSGLGFYAMGDRMTAGSITKTKVAAIYSYRLKINDDAALRMALQPAVNFASYNENSLSFPDQINTNGNATSYGGGAIDTKSFFDVALGAVFSYKRFYAGFAVHHLAAVSAMSVGDATISTPAKFSFNMGYDYSFLMYENSVAMSRRGGYALRLSPNLVIEQQSASNYFAAGAYAALLNVAVGLHYKSSIGNSPHFFIVSAHYSGEIVSAAYHFEFGSFNKSFKVVPANSHEISLFVKFSHRPKSPYWGVQKIDIADKIYDMPDI